jgi:hypothetical protein
VEGHGFSFSRAEQVLYFCHSERASAREESAFRIFSAASLAVPVGRAILAASAAEKFVLRATQE